MRTLIFNNTNVVAGSNNSKYSYNFIGGGFKFNKGDKICVQSIQLPYSWFNISSTNNNNSFGYKLNGTTYNINLQNGFYQVSDLNNILQATLIANGHYLIDVNGNNVYYCQLTTNTALYAIQFDSIPIPATLPAGYTNPSNVLYNSVTFSTPTTIQLVIPSNNMTLLLGFNAGTYPTTPQTSTYSVISNRTPNLTPVNSVVMRCSAIYNNQVLPSDILYSFSPNTTFGSNIVITPSVEGWITCKEGTYSSIDITFVDQNYSSIYMNDNNICCQLLIKSMDD